MPFSRLPITQAILLLLLAFLLPGCDRFDPAGSLPLDRAVDKEPLSVQVFQTTRTRAGELATRQLGHFEAPWRTSFPLQQAAQRPLSFSSRARVEVNPEARSKLFSIFLILRSSLSAPGQSSLHARVFYPGEGTTIKGLRRPFTGTAYAFFVEGTGEQPTDPIHLTFNLKDAGDVSLTLDPDQHTLPAQAALQIDTSDLKKQNPDAGQTTLLVSNPLFGPSGGNHLPFSPLVLVYHRKQQLAFLPDFLPESGKEGTFSLRFLEPLSSNFRGYIFMVDRRP